MIDYRTTEYNNSMQVSSCLILAHTFTWDRPGDQKRKYGSLLTFVCNTDSPLAVSLTDLRPTLNLPQNFSMIIQKWEFQMLNALPPSSILFSLIFFKPIRGLESVDCSNRPRILFLLFGIRLRFSGCFESVLKKHIYAPPPIIDLAFFLLKRLHVTATEENTLKITRRVSRGN